MKAPQIPGGGFTVATIGGLAVLAAAVVSPQAGAIALAVVTLGPFLLYAAWWALDAARERRSHRPDAPRSPRPPAPEPTSSSPADTPPRSPSSGGRPR